MPSAEPGTRVAFGSALAAGGAGGPGGPGGPGERYIVFALRGGKIVPVPITTGLTDQDYIEVTGGLSQGDTVLVLSGATGS